MTDDIAKLMKAAVEKMKAAQQTDAEIYIALHRALEVAIYGHASDDGIPAPAWVHQKVKPGQVLTRSDAMVRRRHTRVFHKNCPKRCPYCDRLCGCTNTHKRHYCTDETGLIIHHWFRAVRIDDIYGRP